MIVLTSMHNERYQELAQETWDNNKVQYAEQHGYATWAKTDDFYGFEPGFEKIQFMLDLFEANPEISWTWWTGSDSLIMNFQTRVEDKIAQADPDAHIIMSGDFNFAINCDSMLVRNSEQSRAWLQDIMDNMPKYAQHQFKEQQYMLDSFDRYEDIIDLQPQHFMNSYEYRMYRVPPWNYTDNVDVHGYRGQWESGDWLVHWPGTQPRERLDLIKEYRPHIIY